MPPLHAEVAARFEDQRPWHPDSVRLGLPQAFPRIRRRDAVTEARAFAEARQAQRLARSLGCEPVQEKEDGVGHEGAAERSAPRSEPGSGAIRK